MLRDIRDILFFYFGLDAGSSRAFSCTRSNHCVLAREKRKYSAIICKAVCSKLSTATTILAFNMATKVQGYMTRPRRKKMSKTTRAHFLPCPIYLMRKNIIPTVATTITTLCVGAGANKVVVHQPSIQVRKLKNIPAYKILVAAIMRGETMLRHTEAHSHAGLPDKQDRWR